MNRNIIELADLLHAEYYTLGQTGKGALLNATLDIYDQYYDYPETSDVFDWLDNADGTRATMSDVFAALSVLARRYEDENLMNVEVS